MTWFFDPLRRRSFDLVMIDVPWRWKNYTQMHNWRSPEAKYETMTMAQAAALPVRDLLCDGGVVWAWGTWPLMDEQPSVMTRGWGLRYCTGGVWGKRTRNGLLTMSTGLVLRGACEPFMILQRGTGKGLRARTVRNLIETFATQEVSGFRREHSRKPQEIYDMLVKLTPGWRRADIFSRERRHGWTRWGNQKDKYTT